MFIDDASYLFDFRSRESAEGVKFMHSHDRAWLTSGQILRRLRRFISVTDTLDRVVRTSGTPLSHRRKEVRDLLYICQRPASVLVIQVARSRRTYTVDLAELYQCSMTSVLLD